MEGYPLFVICKAKVQEDYPKHTIWFAKSN